MTREEAKEILTELWGVYNQDYLTDKESGAVEMAIEALQETGQKKGKWVFNETLGGWHCSECVATAPFLYMESLQHLSAYCPGCGAQMEVEK